MPTTYAHDLFGKKVYQRLPEEMQQVIRSHGNLYRMGLHGPDILFYFLVCKNPVTRYGVQMHDIKARGFFHRVMEKVRNTHNEAMLAYVLGFGCHYLLDSTCHPYVNEMDREGVISHTLLEKEFDRRLMEKTGRDPFRFYPSDCIVPRYRYAKVIHRVFPSIAVPFIYLSLFMMKLCTNAMVCDDGGKRRRVFSKIAALFGEKHRFFVQDHFMAPEVSGISTEPVTRLMELFDQAAAEAPEELLALYGLSKGAQSLSLRWNKTYNG